MEQSIQDWTFPNLCSYLPCETECCQTNWYLDHSLQLLYLTIHTSKQMHDFHPNVYIYLCIYVLLYAILRCTSRKLKSGSCHQVSVHVEMFAIDIRVPVQYSIKFVCTAEDAFIRFRPNLMVLMKFEVQNY